MINDSRQEEPETTLVIKHEENWMDNLDEMMPVEFVGNEKRNPHSEYFTPEDGTVLLDIQDAPMGPKSKA